MVNRETLYDASPSNLVNIHIARAGATYCCFKKRHTQLLFIVSS